MKKLLMACATAALCTSMAAAPAQAETFRYAGPVSPLTFDPHATNDFTTIAVLSQFYDTLLAIGPNMESLPGIATEWESVDESTWRFTIRDDVTFHDGTALTPEDVAFSIERGRKSGYYGALFGKITSATVSGDNTVDVTSSLPDPILPEKMIRMFIFSKAWLEEHDAVEIPDLSADVAAYTVTHENGTGPMKLVSHKADVETRMEAFDGYWGEVTGNVTEAIYTPISAAPTRIASLLSGEVDAITNVPLQDIERLEANDYTITTAPQLLWIQLEMDGSRDVALEVFDKDGTPLETNPWKDVRVRQAVAQAVNADAIVERLLRGRARVMGEATIPEIGGYQPDMDDHWPYDPEAAKALLAEAGYPDGFQTSMNCPNERYVNIEDVCRAVSSMLARVGIDVKVNSMAWPEFAKLLVQGPSSSFHAIGVASVWDTQDAFLSIMKTRDTEAGEGFFNWALWSDPEFDAITDKLRVEFDPETREALYREGLSLAKERVNAVYLYQNQLIWAARPGIEGTMRSDSVLNLTTLTVE
ncbi:ABC transporter substrate-binding protein [Pseudooceanicola sp. HF7]|uniref:ABC transporter substrate-binding protein n=1 Tax=Pseudooceanicola sp. HF7 TaxID=2721560 RepID=UPI0014304D3D|nr:ABC transporter substrate-binding protein [Pseudooceanicola sp. HF7]NIZ11722.1 hypothetical protein [Pseudooceanicola sp. HF7]